MRSLLASLDEQAREALLCQQLDSAGSTALHLAAAKGDVSAIHILLDAKAPVEMVCHQASRYHFETY